MIVGAEVSTMSQTVPPDHGSTQQVPEAPKAKNTLGLVALIVAAVGFVFACVPGALIVGWILLPVAFVLALVSFFVKGKKRGQGVAALLISIVGTVVGVVVFMEVMSSALDDAFSNGDTVVSSASALPDAGEPSESPKPVESQGATEKGSSGGTRENPSPLGSEISNDEWVVTINSVDLDADKAVASSNEFNEPAPDGQVYILVNTTITYVGDKAEGSVPMQTIEYVTVDGNTINSFDTLVVAPDALDSLTTLYEGASVTGNIAFAVPVDTAGDGVLAVAPGMFSDKVFVSVK
ncbi:DUF4352 domain-containing protein [Tessaracoccus caeni]|uniref:DUF4352 domain-containing protein n=1 Tax=Tessaracoccus caeni TaxID=3031239 RepID=UPI0023DB27F9|nr:hypothetical protein [Tessaracoccus caeni]MDF1489477.1 hypothetical protein [Tessaracoccus caeni]